jgi:hypothetical protein
VLFQYLLLSVGSVVQRNGSLSVVDKEVIKVLSLDGQRILYLDKVGNAESGNVFVLFSDLVQISYYGLDFMAVLNYYLGSLIYGLVLRDFI